MVWQVFDTFASHPPGEPADGHPKTLSMEDLSRALSFLNICPAYMSLQQVAVYYQDLMIKKKEKEEDARAQDPSKTHLANVLGFSEPTRLDLEEFLQLMKQLAKHLRLTEENLSRIRRIWLHKPPVTMKSLCARLHPKGEKYTIRSSDVPRKRNDDFQVHLSVGALKIAKETMEVLSQKGMEFLSLQMLISTSWGPEYKTQPLKEFTRETHVVQLERSEFKQEFWLFLKHEDFLIQIPKRAIEDDEWKSACLVCQLEFNYFDYSQAAKSHSNFAGYKSQRVASLTLMMPENVETDGPVEWLAFSQFVGQPDRVKLENDKNALKTSPKMPPMMRMRYRIVREVLI